MKKNYLSLLLSAYLFTNIASANEKNMTNVYDAQRIADIFTTLNADPKDPKKKVNHAVGFCGNGSFLPSSEITSVLDIPFLKQKEINAQVRYSLGGALSSDKTKPRGMAIKIAGADETWTMVMLNTEINFAKNPEEFGQFFEMNIPVDGKQDREKISKLMKEVDSYRNFIEYNSKRGITGSVSNMEFYSIHTFMFKDKKSGDMIPARWKFVPVDGLKYLSKEELEKKSDYFLEDDFSNYVKKAPVAYKMYLVYANKNDVINDTTALWSGEHKEEYVGTLNVTKHSGNVCNSDVYFPSDLPTGVGAPIDPLFDIRNQAYGITFGNRQ